MKQDNRPNNPVNHTIDNLRRLLESPEESLTTVQQEEKEKTEQDVTEKIIVISVNGNNNIVSAGKTGRFIANAVKKPCVILSIAVLTLFF